MKPFAIFVIVMLAVLALMAQHLLSLRSFTKSPASPIPYKLPLPEHQEPKKSALDTLRHHQENNLGFDKWLRAINSGLRPEDMHSLGHNCSLTSRCRVAICTAIYLEEPYLEEWINYQLLIGIDHIYLMILVTLHYAARRSEHFTASLLQPYIQRGQVSLQRRPAKYDVPRVMDQIDVIGQCFRRVKDKADWLLSTDVDEFYFSRTLPSYKHLAAFAEQSKADVLPIPWYMFGSSGHDHKPDGLTGDVYWRRSSVLVYDSETSTWFGRRNGKVFFRASCFKEFKDNTHRVIVQDGCSVTPFAWNHTEYHFKHYQLKSFEDFSFKRRGNGFTGLRVQQAGRGWWNSITRNFQKEWTEQDRLFNDTDDFDMRLYTPVLRQVLPPPTDAWWRNNSDWFKMSWVGPKEPGHGKGPPISS